MSPGLTFIAALSCFLILNAPSVKLFYLSEVINLLAVGSFVYLGLLDVIVLRSTRVGRTPLIVVGLNLVLWALLYLSVLWGRYTMVDPELLVRYFGSVVAILAIAVFLRPTSAYLLTWIQAGWGFILSVSYIVGLVGLHRSQGQHYLTLGVPLAAAILSSIGLMLSARPSKIVRLMLIGNVLLCFAILASLLGRSPILFSIAVLGVTALVYVVTARGAIRKAYGMTLLSAVFIAAVVFSGKYLQDQWIERLNRLVSRMESEPRYETYVKSLDLISTMPFGSGLGAAFDLVGFYPHNIFLEVALSAGVLAVLPLLALCWMLFSRFLQAVQHRTRFLGLCMVAIYMLLTWNVSFDLGTAYVPLGFAAAAIVAISRGECIEGFSGSRDAQSAAHASKNAAELDRPDPAA